ncbi:MAG: DUF192 domain-containing protein [bacterium]
MPALSLNGVILIPHLTIAGTFHARAEGLLGKSGLEPGYGLLIRPCSSIHTLFMRFPIDVIFLDSQNRVVRIVRNLPPWRMARGGWKAQTVVEVQSGWLPAIQTGGKLEIRATP